MGNTRSTPYSYCVDAHAGIDADIVSWEMVSDGTVREQLVFGVGVSSTRPFVIGRTRRNAVIYLCGSAGRVSPVFTVAFKRALPSP